MRSLIWTRDFLYSITAYSRLLWRTLPYWCSQQKFLGKLSYDGVFALFCPHRPAKNAAERAPTTPRSCQWMYLCVSRICSIRSALVELAVPAHFVSDFFAEATSSMPHAQREACSCCTLEVYASLVFVRSRVSFRKAVASSPNVCRPRGSCVPAKRSLRNPRQFYPVLHEA